MKKVIIERLPETKEIDGAKRWIDEKGEFVQVSYREDIGHLAYFELKKDQFRGKHFHEKKEEVLYIIDGEIRAIFLDLDTSEIEEYILHKGERIHVPTRVAHVFYGLKDAKVVEYSPQYYDKEDAPRVDMPE
ncbi:MAG TPA: cupin domain-containing protein, partial [Syntrophorhabdaceae bacterium]|nr:cupin domain-containing protein [Syntrophorhabdaceae bacterium]